MRRPPLFLGLLYGAIVLVALFICYRLYETHHAASLLQKPSMGYASGPKDADIVLVSIVDYRCSHCRDVYPVIKAVAEKHPDVRVVYRIYPGLGRASLIEAEFALAAEMQGKFLPVHDYLMSSEQPIDEERVPEIAKGFGLDTAKLAIDMKGPEIGEHLLETVAASEALGIRQTPTFLINGRLFKPIDLGRMPVEGDFNEIIEELR